MVKTWYQYLQPQVETNHKSSPTVLRPGPESDLCCISADKDDKATRLTPSKGLRMFRFRCLGCRRNIDCMQESTNFGSRGWK
jgi:hypothetical protein